MKRSVWWLWLLGTGMCLSVVVTVWTVAAARGWGLWPWALLATAGWSLYWWLQWWRWRPWHDVTKKEPERCAHCGHPALGYARGYHGERLCHHESRDCYHEMTVGGEH